MKKQIFQMAAYTAVLFLWSCSCVFAGALNPPGPPTSGTMKPLDEVEPRIPIRQADMPLTISTAGSYYLTEDVTVSHNAITLATDNVTIDLCGYALIGSGGAFIGLYTQGHGNVEIRNGTIRSFGRGISATFESDTNLRIVNLRVLASSGEGIYCLGSNVLVENCFVSGCGAATSSQAFGIYVGDHSAVLNCQVMDIGNLSSSGSAVGIHANESSRVVGSTVSKVGRTVPYAYGIRTWAGCVVDKNTVLEIGDSATMYAFGIYADAGTAVTGNTISLCGENANYARGIYTLGSCIIRDNSAHANGGHAASFHGILGGTASNISGNTVCNNGIHSGGGTALFANPSSRVVGNTCYGNGTSSTGTVYGIRTSNDCLIDQNVSYGNGGLNLYILTNCTYGTNHAP